MDEVEAQLTGALTFTITFRFCGVQRLLLIVTKSIGGLLVYDDKGIKTLGLGLGLGLYLGLGT